MQIIADFGRAAPAKDIISFRKEHNLPMEEEVIDGGVGIATWYRNDGKKVLVTYCADAGAQGSVEVGTSKEIDHEIERLRRETQELTALSNTQE